MLAGARVRNYDLTTALSVLTTGRYDALPSVVRESFAGEEKMKDEEVIGTMREVDEVLRWRLVMGLERLPRGLRLAPYRIGEALSFYSFDYPRMSAERVEGTKTTTTTTQLMEGSRSLRRDCGRRALRMVGTIRGRRRRRE